VFLTPKDLRYSLIPLGKAMNWYRLRAAQLVLQVCLPDSTSSKSLWQTQDRFDPQWENGVICFTLFYDKLSNYFLVPLAAASSSSLPLHAFKKGLNSGFYVFAVAFSNSVIFGYDLTSML
jgi:hypothetical protein